ncbi:MAG: 5-oxoprolinase subunit PxpA [Actinomycetota bacterium]|nr:5-oxoprolinase subunit PxpA [Actinomycetota bacterium]
MERAIDLNADLGEGYGAFEKGDDAALLEIVTSANVACGFHAGDPARMARTARLAAARGVVIGAHVAYPDLRGFGRRHVALTSEELRADVTYQIGALSAICAAVGTRVAFVKAHGALYNDAADDARVAGDLVEAVARLDGHLGIVALAGSVLADLAGARGCPVVREGFPDRAYLATGRLAPRDRPGACIEEAGEIAARAIAIARGDEIDSIDGSPLSLEADTICVHGDAPGAVTAARAIREALAEAGVMLRPALA